MRPDNTLSVHATVIGAEAALAIAKVAGEEAKLRKHPGHKFAVKFILDKEVYEPKERVTVTMTLENVGDVPVTFQGAMLQAHRDNNFSFSVIRDSGMGKALPETGDPGDLDVVEDRRTLKPGETFKKSVRLDERFKFEDDDIFHVTCTYRTTLVDPKVMDGRNLWEDFVAGTCVVIVRTKEKE